MKNNTLTLSIVIPVYNEELHLKSCLDSVAIQTVMPNEVIVVDNNSTDKSVEIAKRYSFVKVIREKRQGVVFTRDNGFDSVKSKLIGRIDADTILPPDWVMKVRAFFENPAHENFGLTGGAYFYNMRFGRIGGWFQNQIAFRQNRLLMGHYILYGSNMAIAKEAWLKVRGSVCHDQDVHEDLDLAIHMYRAGFKITYLANLKVGVKMRRVFEDRQELWHNLLWWPKTLRRHGMATWVFGLTGAVGLYLAALLYPIFRKK